MKKKIASAQAAQTEAPRATLRELMRQGRWWLWLGKATLCWAATAVLGYLLVMLVATVGVPMIAATLHQQSGAAGADLNWAGMIAFWLAPLLMILAVLTALVWKVLRSMWFFTAVRVRMMRQKVGRPEIGSGATSENRSKS